jgi:hypothetical protein
MPPLLQQLQLRAVEQSASLQQTQLLQQVAGYQGCSSTPLGVSMPSCTQLPLLLLRQEMWQQQRSSHCQEMAQRMQQRQQKAVTQRQ